MHDLDREHLFIYITTVANGSKFSKVDYLLSGKVSRYATIETPELRVPLTQGWRRETLVREYSKSGVRGDVVYYAPCGKKFKQYPDIIRVRVVIPS